MADRGGLLDTVSSEIYTMTIAKYQAGMEYAWAPLVLWDAILPVTPKHPAMTTFALWQIYHIMNFTKTILLQVNINYSGSDTSVRKNYSMKSEENSEIQTISAHKSTNESNKKRQRQP